MPTASTRRNDKLTCMVDVRALKKTQTSFVWRRHRLDRDGVVPLVTAPDS